MSARQHPDHDVDPEPPRQSRWFLVVLALLAIVLLTIYIKRKPRGGISATQHPGVGGQVERLTLSPLLNTEHPVATEDLQGKVTLINFWGPWCPPCLREFPELADLEKSYRGREDVQFLLISSPSPGETLSVPDLEASSAGVLMRLKSDAAIYYDNDRETRSAIKTAAKMEQFVFPTTVLLDRKGIIRAVWTGYLPETVGEMGTMIEQLLAADAT